jgi:hypothetical protein
MFCFVFSRGSPRLFDVPSQVPRRPSDLVRAQVTITFEFDKAMYMTVLVQVFIIRTVGSRVKKRLHSRVYKVYEDIVVSQHLAGVA